MGLFGFGSKRQEIVDLAERYRQKKDREASEGEAEKNINEAFERLGSEDEASDSLINPEEKKKRLAKRILDIVNRLDDLSNKIYHLQQRVELLERKADIGRAES